MPDPSVLQTRTSKLASTAVAAAVFVNQPYKSLLLQAAAVLVELERRIDQLERDQDRRA